MKRNWPILRKCSAKHTYYAIGEIGIDLYWEKELLKEQQVAFKKQIQLAKKHKLPIVIHCREAFDEVFEILESEKGADLRGIFHCFTGSFEQAKLAISYNMKLGIGGVVTFKNGKIDTFLNQIDIKHIVLETDAPYLAPTPFRGKRNESGYILKVLEKVSDIYEMHDGTSRFDNYPEFKRHFWSLKSYNGNRGKYQEKYFIDLYGWYHWYGEGIRIRSLTCF